MLHVSKYFSDPRPSLFCNQMDGDSKTINALAFPVKIKINNFEHTLIQNTFLHPASRRA